MERARTRRAGAVSGVLLILAACAVRPTTPPPPPPAAAPELDASYDWHGLLEVPFGTVLKDTPLTLHEVLMFRDAGSTPPGDDAECYAVGETPPRFLARTPREYLLCFKQDHLARVEATVRLPPQEAARIFGDACGLWRKNANAGPAGSSACDGRDGAVAFSGRLEDDEDAAGRAVSIRLDALSEP